MKYKQPKFSGYKNVHHRDGGNSKFASIPKPARIIIIVVAAILAVAILVLGVLSIIDAVKKKKTEEFNKQLKEIQISHLPDKRTYYCGNSFDTTGLVVYSVTNGGTFTKLDLDACTITGFDSSVPVKEQTITVTYKEFTATFLVEIKEEEAPIPMLVSIEMGVLPKTEYKVGEGLKTTGGTFIATYSDGTTKTIELSNKYVSGFSAAKKQGVGEYDLRVIYNENGVQVETTYKITITE